MGKREDDQRTAGFGAEESAEPGTLTGREYRAGELAEAAGITPRTLRFYRERKLLPPPRKQGRVTWYDERHLARLRTISALLARGHTLGGIAELILAFEKGRGSAGAAELLGVTPTLTARFSEETSVRLTPEELAARFPDEDTAENLSTAIELGYLSIEGDEIVHISQRLLDASAVLVEKGVPLAAVLEAGRRMRQHVGAISTGFADLLREHLLTAENRFETAAEAVEALRPYAKQVVDAELSMALDRELRAEIEAFFALSARGVPVPGEGPPQPHGVTPPEDDEAPGQQS